MFDVPREDPLAGELPTDEQLSEAFHLMITGASGWRKVFAKSGDEEDPSPDSGRADLFLTALAAQAFACETDKTSVIVARDSRPTGAILAAVVIRMLLAQGKRVRYLDICCAPEIMAFSATLPDSCFFFITASHNPIGYNGFKFGSDGKVFDETLSSAIIARFQTMAADRDAVEQAQRLSAAIETQAYDMVLRTSSREKEQALLAYERLLLRISADSEDEIAYGTFIAMLKHDLKRHPLGIVGELNGSARCTSLDRQFLAALGIRTRFLNDSVGQIVHPIICEGDSLEMCRKALQEAHEEDAAFQIGYVPDNDGDRGNIVYYDPKYSGCRILEAQSLFALIALIELSQAKRENVMQAIAVNGPTSLMVDAIAARLGVRVARSEVGEANVVALAEQLRAEGYEVRLCGEGSNGGVIMHPSKVRDPMNTLVSLAKLLSSGKRFRRITGHAGHPSLATALASLPKRTITGSFSSEAVMRVPIEDQRLFKRTYEQLFIASYGERSTYLQSHFGIFGWREEQTEGTHMRIGVGDAFRVSATGGLKIVFLDRDEQATDFIWMRKSKTEPVLRIMADAMGDDQERHDYLLRWQRSLVEKTCLTLGQ